MGVDWLVVASDVVLTTVFPALIESRSAAVRVTVCVWASSFDVVLVTPPDGGAVSSVI